MTDRYNALVVTLNKDYRDDEAQQIIDAIKMIKGVLTVDGNVTDIDSHVAHERIKSAYRLEIHNAIADIFQ